MTYSTQKMVLSIIIVITSTSFAQLITVEDNESAKEQGPLANETALLNSTRYRRFHANDTLLGQPVPCSRQEKLCFQRNLLYYPKWDKCVALGEGGDDDCDFHADKEEFLHGSGNLVGVCDARPLQRCPRRLGVRMAWDGECYAHALVRDEICACADLPSLHPLGGRECRCHSPTHAAATPVSVQPEEDGRCVVPALQWPLPAHQLFSGAGLPREGRASALACGPHQRRCFGEGALWLPAAERCVPPASAAPCPAGHVAGLRRDARLRGRAEGGCVPSDGGCAPGRIRMAFDGRCHDRELMRLTAPAHLEVNMLGEHDPVFKYTWGVTLTFIKLAVVDNACVINITLYNYVIPAHGVPPFHTTTSNPELIDTINANRPSPE